MQIDLPKIEKEPVTKDDSSLKDLVKRALTTSDTALRSHLITFAYSQLATAIDQAVFDDTSVHATRGLPSNANWFNFATWGTYTLGPNIRNDEAPQRLDSLAGLRSWVAPAIIHSRGADGNLVGRALSWGQYLIFLTTAKKAVDFLALHDDDLLPLSTSDRLPMLPDGSPDALSSVWFDQGHLDVIAKAFHCYSQARRYVKSGRWEHPDVDPIPSRLMLLGTVLLTAVEQDIIDSALRTVVDAVPVRWIRSVDGRVARLVAAREGVPREVVALNLLDQISEMTPKIVDTFARLLTGQMLVMVLPRETLRLGRDIPPLDPAGPLYFNHLDDLSLMPEEELTRLEPEDPALAESIRKSLAELRRYVLALDRTGPDGAGSGARDWRRFDDRLNWAVCLFRSRQQDPTLFWSPYSDADQARLLDGKLPRGRAGGPVTPPLDPSAVEDFLGQDWAFTREQPSE